MALRPVDLNQEIQERLANGFIRDHFDNGLAVTKLGAESETVQQIRTLDAGPDEFFPGSELDDECFDIFRCCREQFDFGIQLLVQCCGHFDFTQTQSEAVIRK